MTQNANFGDFLEFSWTCDQTLKYWNLSFETLNFWNFKLYSQEGEIERDGSYVAKEKHRAVSGSKVEGQLIPASNV